MWNLLTGVLVEELYNYMENINLLPEEQKECRKQSRPTKDNLLFDIIGIRNCSRKLMGLNVVWVEYKKVLT